MSEGARVGTSEMVGDSTPVASGGRSRLLLLFALLALVLGFGYLPTFQSMVEIWWRSETFAHGFLIFPISAWLIWRIRDRVAAVPWRTDLRAVVPLLLFGFAWSIANLADVLVVQQAAVVAMIPVLVWLVFGWAATWTMLFPLAFLAFAVPVGEGLIPPMMDFTAAFTVHALRLTGIPVYWEGTFFHIPSGRWSVVEGCAGVRYLIASVTLGCLYAYLTYSRPWKRTLFVLFSIVVPIFANGMRAYMIVMIAHLSDMKLALGVDHLIYGWVFFGIVMLVLFWVGSYWRDDAEPESGAVQGAADVSSPGTSNARYAGVLVAGLALVAVWPAWAAHVRTSGPADQASLSAPGGAAGWMDADPFTGWQPVFVNPSAEFNQAYRDEHTRVGVHVAYYATQSQDAELVNSQNVLIEQKHEVWRQPYRRSAALETGGTTIRVSEAELQSVQQNLLVWHWYRTGGTRTSNPYEAKLREALVALTGGGRSGAGFVVYTELGEDRDAARGVLRRFLGQMLVPLETAVDSARGGG